MQLARWVIIASLVSSVSSNAYAAPPDIPTRQAEIRRALDGLGLALGGDELSFGPRGRRDLVLFSPRPRDAIIASLKATYRAGQPLANGYRVAGWALIIKTNTYTFTLKDSAETSWVIELADDGGGSRVSIWGVGRFAQVERRPRAQLPLRLVTPE
jgi:hypothetical protein